LRVEGVESSHKHSAARGVAVSPHRRLRNPVWPAILQGTMKPRAMNAGYAANVGSTLRKQGPFVALSLGGVFTVLWIGVVSLIPLRLIFSAVSFAVTNLPHTGL
jgi:hypothetical protein